MFSFTDLTINMCECTAYKVKGDTCLYFTEEDLKKMLDHFTTMREAIVEKLYGSALPIEKMILDGYLNYTGECINVFRSTLQRFEFKASLRPIMKPDFTVVDATTTVYAFVPSFGKMAQINVSQTVVKDLISHWEDFKRGVLLTVSKAVEVATKQDSVDEVVQGLVDTAIAGEVSDDDGYDYCEA